MPGPGSYENVFGRPKTAGNAGVGFGKEVRGREESRGVPGPGAYNHMEMSLVNCREGKGFTIKQKYSPQKPD